MSANEVSCCDAEFRMQKPQLSQLPCSIIEVFVISRHCLVASDGRDSLIVFNAKRQNELPIVATSPSQAALTGKMVPDSQMDHET